MGSYRWGVCQQNTKAFDEEDGLEELSVDKGSKSETVNVAGNEECKNPKGEGKGKRAKAKAQPKGKRKCGKAKPDVD